MELNGLIVDYDSQKNIVMYNGIKEYPIGGMIAEYANLDPKALKNIILSYDKMEDNNHDTLSDFFLWFADKIEKKFGTVTAAITMFEFMDYTFTISKSVISYTKKQLFDKFPPHTRDFSRE